MNELEEKQAKELRRFVEKLTMARAGVKNGYDNLVDADFWAGKERALTVQRLYKQAEQLQEDIEKLLREVQGE